MTPNQLVAQRIRDARNALDWTQERAADELEIHLGVRWSTATWSAAERSVDGVRVREFTADEIVALARALHVEVCYFFGDHEHVGVAAFTTAANRLAYEAARLVETAGAYHDLTSTPMTGHAPHS